MAKKSAIVVLKELYVSIDHLPLQIGANITNQTANMQLKESDISLRTW